MANVSSEKLNELIENKLVPNASYVINSDIVISSSLNDTHKITVEKRYFHSSVLELIKDNSEHSDSEKFKIAFKQNLVANLKNHAH
jgi:hypothetical protein